jgi:XTP/dITP diphosphohydrolase
MAQQMKIKVVYVTSSKFKVQENEAFIKHCKLKDGTYVRDLFEFEIRANQIKEILEVDLKVMVQAEVVSAYSQIKVPCIVEHAGLIFKDYEKESYPGGLTKPMWDTLGDNFLNETNSAGRKATARAVIAYCDGMTIRTFVGETHGKLADKLRGSRKFYWDTVFMPVDPNGKVENMTYAEIVEDKNLGLPYKMEYLSQSSKAMIDFLEYLRENPRSTLWG